MLDLSRLERIEPLLVVRLAAWMDVQSVNERRVTVIPPERPGIGVCLAAAGIDELQHVGGLAAPGRHTAEADVLLPLVRLDCEADLVSVVLQLKDVLEHHSDIELESGRIAMQQALNELGDNATTHGANEHGAYVAAMRCANGRCALAVGDLGVGIPTHMRQTHGADVGDGEAIERAMLMRASGTPDQERGVGYRGIVREMTKGAIPHARLRIWSGGASHSLVVGRGKIRDRCTDPNATPTAGTWVTFEVDASPVPAC